MAFLGCWIVGGFGVLGRDVLITNYCQNIFHTSSAKQVNCDIVGTCDGGVGSTICEWFAFPFAERDEFVDPFCLDSRESPAESSPGLGHGFHPPTGSDQGHVSRDRRDFLCLELSAHHGWTSLGAVGGGLLGVAFWGSPPFFCASSLAWDHEPV